MPHFIQLFLTITINYYLPLPQLDHTLSDLIRRIYFTESIKSVSTTMSVAITSNNNKQPQPQPQPHLKVVNNNSTFNLYTWLRSVFQYCISLIISYTSNWLLVNNDNNNNININYKSNNNDNNNNNASISLQPKISNVKAESMKIFPDLQKSNFTTYYTTEKPLHQDVLKPVICSTGITSRILPYTNEKGELEWKFTEVQGKELDEFKMHPQQQQQQEVKQELSPAESNESNESLAKDSSTTPASISDSPLHSETESTVSSTIIANSNQIFKCPSCDAEFRVRGYLTRHMKKHSTKKAYTCPFHDKSIYVDENNITHKCHSSGGFSRRDTYKTHLKLRHFNYAKPIKSAERSKVPGQCAMCGEHFNSAEIWCEIHVEGGECKFLPMGFKGKSRIKNRLKKQIQKNKMIDPELVPFASKVLEEVEQERQKKKNYRTTGTGSESSIQSQESESSINSTPLSMQISAPVPMPVSIQQQHQHQHQHHHHHVQNQNQQHVNQQQSIATPASIYSSSASSTSSYESTHSPYTPQSSRSPLSHMYNPQQPPYFNQIAQAHQQDGQKNQVKDDYDDEYCLDVDQLNTTFVNEIVANYLQIHDFHSMNQYQPGQQQQQQHQQQQPSMYF